MGLILEARSSKIRDLLFFKVCSLWESGLDSVVVMASQDRVLRSRGLLLYIRILLSGQMLGQTSRTYKTSLLSLPSQESSFR